MTSPSTPTIPLAEEQLATALLRAAVLLDCLAPAIAAPRVAAAKPVRVAKVEPRLCGRAN